MTNLLARHNSILTYIGRNLRHQGFTVYNESHNTTSEGLRKPDIVAIMRTLGVVIDVQVAGEQFDLERARALKVKKYAGNPDIQRAIQDLGARNILLLPAIISCRGVWCKKSADDLLGLGTINRRYLAVIVTRVLIGGTIAHRVFNTITAVRNWSSTYELLLPLILPAFRHNLRREYELYSNMLYIICKIVCNYEELRMLCN